MPEALGPMGNPSGAPGHHEGKPPTTPPSPSGKPTAPSQTSTQNHTRVVPKTTNTSPVPFKKTFKDVPAVNVYKVKEGVDEITHGLSFEHISAPSNLELHIFYSSHSGMKLSYAYELSARLRAMFTPYLTARPFTHKGVGGIEVRIQRKPVVSVLDKKSSGTSKQSTGSQSKQNTLDPATKNLITSHIQGCIERGIRSPYLVLESIDPKYLEEAAYIMHRKLEAVSKKEEYSNPKYVHYAKSARDFVIAGTPKGMLRIKKGEVFSYRLDVPNMCFFLSLPTQHFLDVKVPFTPDNSVWIIDSDPPSKTMLKPYIGDASNPL